MKKNLPHLRFSITDKCNFFCQFCSKKGENGIYVKENLNIDEYLYALAFFRDLGFSHLKITGGEPLLEEFWDVVALDAKKIGFEKVDLLTNGQLITDTIFPTHRKIIDRVFVTMTTLSEKKYKNTTGGGDIKKTIDGLKKLSKLKIPTIVHFIVMNSNFGQIMELIDFCTEMGCNLKILELLKYRVSPKYFAKEYISNSKVLEWLLSKRKDIESREIFPDGNFGRKMTQINTKNGVELTIVGIQENNKARFGKNCIECKKYPCQDGLYGIRFTCDGRILRCWGEPVGRALWKNLKEGDTENARKNIQSIICEFYEGWEAPVC